MFEAIFPFDITIVKEGVSSTLIANTYSEIDHILELHNLEPYKVAAWLNLPTKISGLKFDLDSIGDRFSIDSKEPDEEQCPEYIVKHGHEYRIDRRFGENREVCVFCQHEKP